MAEWTKKFPETDEEIAEAIAWCRSEGILPPDTPTKAQQTFSIDPKLMDDIRDLLFREAMQSQIQERT
jgi:hypothetical protein